MRRVLVVVALVLLVGAAAWWHYRPQPPHYEQAFVGEGHVTLWSSTAQVREALATLRYGDHIDILAKYGDQVKARTATGAIGWVDGRELLFEDVWRRANELTARARSFPAQAHGHTKVLSNLRLEPARDGTRILQLARDVPVQMLERRAVDVPGGVPKARAAAAAPKREDWWLVRANVKDLGEASGWLLGRFVQLDPPEPLPEYATAAAMHIIGWYELNQVLDPDGRAHPQYLVVGTGSGEGLDCDFNMMRTFTWSNSKLRYETAYLESGLCGRLPVTVSPGTTPGGDASFHFADAGGSGEFTYHLRQTIIRRVGGEKAKGQSQKQKQTKKKRR